MDLTELAHDINQACRLEGTFVLRSGQTSNEYFDKYLFESQPALLLRVAEAMVWTVPASVDTLRGCCSS
ncbi:orotate phosphoribosyltransferase [Nakamurella sp. UYEF19]